MSGVARQFRRGRAWQGPFRVQAGSTLGPHQVQATLGVTGQTGQENRDRKRGQGPRGGMLGGPASGSNQPPV
jgi:hypothetical protein